MNNQTDNYIILKPMSERFNEVAKSITEDDMKTLIKERLRAKIDEQLNHLDFQWKVQEIFDEYISANIGNIEDMLKNAIAIRLK